MNEHTPIPAPESPLTPSEHRDVTDSNERHSHNWPNIAKKVGVGALVGTLLGGAMTAGYKIGESRPPEFNPASVKTITNESGDDVVLCIGDGANIREVPAIDVHGNPVAPGEVVATLNTDGVKDNGLLSQPKEVVMTNPEQVACVKAPEVTELTFPDGTSVFQLPMDQGGDQNQALTDVAKLFPAGETAWVSVNVADLSSARPDQKLVKKAPEQSILQK